VFSLEEVAEVLEPNDAEDVDAVLPVPEPRVRVRLPQESGNRRKDRPDQILQERSNSLLILSTNGESVLYRHGNNRTGALCMRRIDLFLQLRDSSSVRFVVTLMFVLFR
jgi:hypothetical protein